MHPSPDSDAVIGAIPARYDSRRLPGKPLRRIAGRPMIEHVYRRCLQAPSLARVVVLTDDERVGAAVLLALKQGVDGVELVGLAPERLAALFPELAGQDLAQALSVEALLARRACVGGTAPERVREEVERWKERLESWPS